MKVLASDFDGTVYFEDGFHEEDLKYIRKFQSAGHMFGMCTGRPLKGVEYYTKDYFKYDFCISSSGALITDGNGHILYEQCIDFSDMKAIYEVYSKDYWVSIQADGIMYNEHLEGALEVIQKKFVDIDELASAHIYGLSINGKDEHHAQQICMHINQAFSQVCAFQNKEFIDVVKVGCSKGEGIKKLKELLNVKEIAGIGDSFNDLPLLDATNPSFTFESSPHVVQEHATTVIHTLAEAIQTLI